MNNILGESVLKADILIHKVSRNKAYLRNYMNNRKCNPLLTYGLMGSFLRSIESIKKNAAKVTYPYLLILGEKDLVVDNTASRNWHAATTSTTKEIKLMAGSFHELSKEPNNGTMFETVLKFAVKRASEGAQAFGVLNPKEVNFSKRLLPKAAAGKSKLRLLTILYFLVGLVLAFLRKRKSLFLIWPALPFLKK